MSKDIFAGVRDFITVAGKGSFTAAAEELGVTGSALSKSVVRLELRLGLKLLHRTTRKVTLTNEGEAYFASCLKAIGELEDAENGLGGGLREPAGRVRVDLPAAFGRRHVLPTLIDLASIYPKLELSVTFSERTVDLVEDGIDLSIRIGSLRDDAELIARRLGAQKLVLCTAPSYLSKRGAPSSKEDLESHDLVVGWRRGMRHQWLLKNSHGVAEPYEISVHHEFADGEGMLAATVAGCGICQLPTWLITEELRAGRLVTVLDELSGAEMPIHAIWPRSRFIQPKLRVIVDQLAKLAKLPGSGFNN